MAKPKAIRQLVSTILIDETCGDAYVKTRIELNNGEVEQKTLSFDDYCTWLLGARKEKRQFVKLNNALPKYYLDGMVSNDADSFKVQLLVPAGKHQMVSQHFDFADTIPYPALLFNLEFDNGRAIRKECYAVVPEKDGTIKADSPLYRYPYGNVSASGDICMGNIAVKCSSLAEANKFCEEFFLGIDEGHYYEPKVMVNQSWNLGKLYQEVIKKDKFPVRWLVPNGKTYKNIMFK